MISDVAPPQKVDVQTYVTGQATVKSDVEVRIIAPPGFGTQVTQSKGGTATVPLNTGKSMPDAGSSGQ